MLFERPVSFPLISPCVSPTATQKKHSHTHTHTHRHKQACRLNKSFYVSTLLAYTYCIYSRTDKYITSHLSRHILSPSQAHTLRQTRSLWYCAPGWPPSPSAPPPVPTAQLWFARDRGSGMWTVFVYTRLCNKRRVAFLSAGVCYNCISPPAVDWCVDSVGACVCGSRSSSSCYFEEWSLLVSRARFMSRKLLSDKTRLWGDLGLRCQGHSVVCIQYICVFYAISHRSSNRAPLRLLSVVPSFVSERGCDPVWRNSLLGFSLSICWKITAQATFEEVSSHPTDPCFHPFIPTSTPISFCPLSHLLSVHVLLSVCLYHFKAPFHCT